MLTDDDLRRELTMVFHEQADPIARTAIEPAALFQRALWQRRCRAAARAGAVLAVAVAAIVSLVTVAGRPAAGPATTVGPAGVLLAAAVTTAPPAAAAARGMPRLFVVADHGRPVAIVRDSVTGRPVNMVDLSAGTDPKLTQVTAAGDDRTFVLAVFSLSRGTRFYELRITPGGRPAGLARLAIPPLPAGEAADAIALTPDGTRLAVAIQTVGQHGQIDVITLATGAVRTWTTTHAGTPETLSWDAAGRRLAYFWTDTGPGADGLWLLDTSAPGTRLLSGRRILPQTVGPDEVQSALLTPDAHSIIASVTYNGTRQVSHGTVVGGIVEISAQTGRPLRTLLAERAAYSVDAGWYITSCLLASIDTTGNHLLVSCARFGRLDRGRFTALPGAAPQTAVATAW
jgi:YD repeat-containing protein